MTDFQQRVNALKEAFEYANGDVFDLLRIAKWLVGEPDEDSVAFADWPNFVKLEDDEVIISTKGLSARIARLWTQDNEEEYDLFPDIVAHRTAAAMRERGMLDDEA